MHSLRFYTNSVSLGKVQTTRIHIVNKKNEVLRTEFVNVNVGDTKTISLPGISGYSAPDKNYSYTIIGDTDGVKTVSITYDVSKAANLVNKDGEWYLMQDDQVVLMSSLAQVYGTGTW